MNATSMQVGAKLDASAARIFDILATPHRHPETDASGMVVSDDNTSPITKVGQVFRMNMEFVDASGTTRYQTDNHVTAFEPGKLIAWRVAPVDGEVLGWEWRYELAPASKDRTEVRLTYDWTATPEANMARYGVPNFTEADLRDSLARLASAVTAD